MQLSLGTIHRMFRCVRRVQNPLSESSSFSFNGFLTVEYGLSTTWRKTYTPDNEELTEAMILHGFLTSQKSTQGIH